MLLTFRVCAERAMGRNWRERRVDEEVEVEEGVNTVAAIVSCVFHLDCPGAEGFGWDIIRFLADRWVSLCIAIVDTSSPTN